MTAAVAPMSQIEPPDQVSGDAAKYPPTLIRLRVTFRLVEEEELSFKSDASPTVNSPDEQDTTSSLPLPHRLYTKELTRKQKTTFEEAKDWPIMMIDAAFDHLHTERNILSVGSQFSYAYHHLTAATKPCFLIICGIGHRLLQQLIKQGAFHWRCYLTTVPLEDIIERSRKLRAGDNENLTPLFEDAPKWLEETRLRDLQFVYLSADATQYLEGTPIDKKVSQEEEEGDTPTSNEQIPFTLNTVCVIGGLIDRNRYKGFCYNKARSLGIPAAKLPIDSILEASRSVEYVGTRVMTIDQTCALIQFHVDGDSWEVACEKAVPQRRIKKD